MPHVGNEAEWLTLKKRVDSRLRALNPTMFSTGVDIPSLEFIVFLRPVKSRILTMLGRGTRLAVGP